MRCKQIHTQLIEYLEDALDARSREQIDHHLHQCPTCREELQAFKATIEMLQTVPVQEPPDAFWTGFTSEVMGKIREMETPQASSWAWAWRFLSPQFRWVAIAVTIALVFIGAALVYSRLDGNNQSPSEIAVTLPGERTQPPVTEQNLDTILAKIVPENLPQNMLESDFALLGEEMAPTAEMDYSDEMLYALISSLSEQEKAALLQVLERMKEERP